MEIPTCNLKASPEWKPCHEIFLKIENRPDANILTMEDC